MSTESHTGFLHGVAAMDPRQINGTQVLVVPEGYEVHEFTGLRDKPIRITESEALRDLSSFVHYVSRFSGEHAIVQHDRDSMRLRAIMDYHGPTGEAGWCAHIADLQFRTSRELDAWLKLAGRDIPQALFAEHLEDRIAEVIEPTGSVMLGVAANLEATKTEKYSSGIRLQNGDTELTFTRETNAKGSTVVPAKFTIAVPLWTVSKTRVALDATLRYRINNGALTFRFHFPQLEDVRDAAWDKELETVRSGLGEIPMFASQVN